MTRKQRAYYVKKAMTGELSDEMNPIFILNCINTSLLLDVVNGKLDLNELAKSELQNRGLDNTGKWIGFSFNR